MKNKNSNNYISLQEAERICSYSHEYLGLRARQGRLKSLKLGKTWVTKKEWLKEYTDKAKKRHNNAKLRIQKKLKKRTRQKQRTLLKVFIILIAISLTTGMFLNEKTFVLETFKEYGQWVSIQTAAISQRQNIKPLQEEKEPILIKRINEDKF